MIISLIAAMTKDRVIGINNKLPWHLSADLINFKKITMGKPIIMGRKTFESIGKPLPGRHNIIVTRNVDFFVEGCDIVGSIEAAFNSVREDEEEVMVIGGAEIFEHALPFAERLYFTFVDAEVSGDVFFPEWESEKWQEVSREDHAADDRNEYGFSFVVYELSKK